MARSTKKGPYVDPKLYQKVEKLNDAQTAFDALGVRMIPTVVVFGPDGKSRWSGVGSEGLEAALDAAIVEARRDGERP